MSATLSERFPILEVADNLIVSKMGDVTAGFEVTKPEIFTLSGAQYEILHETFVKALKVLPRGSVFHMQDKYSRDHFRGDPDKAGDSFLGRASERFFNGREFMNHTCHLFLTKKPAGRKAASSAMSGLLRKFLVPDDTLNPSAIHAFEDAVGQFCHILSDSGLVKLRRLQTHELVSTKKAAGIIEGYCHLLDPDAPLLLKDIDLRDSIKIGDRHCLLFTLADPEKLPSQCAPSVPYGPYSSDRIKLPVGFAAGLGLLLPCNHIYNQYIVFDDAAVTLKKMEKKRLRLQSLSAYSRENAISQEATNAFLNEAIGSQRQPVKAHFNILAWTEQPGELTEIRNKVSAAMANIDAVAHLETLGAPQLWWAGIPGNAGDLPVNECFDTFLEQSCCFLNTETNYRSSDSFFGLRFGDRLTGRPVHVDIDVEPRKLEWTQNDNTFILSGSGGGKSFLVNHICRSYYEQGSHVVIVDIGHSYQALCSLLNGYYFTYTQENPFRFNPFFIQPGEVFDSEKMESLKSLLLVLWKKPDESHNRSEYVGLSNALEKYYNWLPLHPESFPSFNTFFEYVDTKYSKVLEMDSVKEKEFDLQNFLYVIRPYYRGGEFDFLLNATENLDLLEQRFVVFELDAIKDHPTLFGVLTILIMEVFMTKARQLRGVRKVIVIEEAWKAIANSAMAERIRYWAKTLRKFMAKLVLVSQEIEDMVSSPIIKQAILNNSDCRILLDQSKFQNKFDFIQELLGISEKQKAEILSINKGHEPGRKYKDCWISLGPSHSRVYRLETSEEEYLAYTSDQGDKLKVEQYAKKCGGFQQGIERMAEDLRGEK